GLEEWGRYARELHGRTRQDGERDRQQRLRGQARVQHARGGRECAGPALVDDRREGGETHRERDGHAQEQEDQEAPEQHEFDHGLRSSSIAATIAASSWACSIASAFSLWKPSPPRS